MRRPVSLFGRNRLKLYTVWDEPRLQHLLDDQTMQNIHSLLSERDRVTRLLTYLQARRALSMPPSSLNETRARMSARKIVHECSAHIEAVDDSSLMVRPILK